MFYIQPPKGLVALHTLEEIVFSRLEYLNILDNSKRHVFNGKFEYLLEGSVFDCIGHFILRLLLWKYNEFFSHWLNKETLLLKKRLSVVQPKSLYRLFTTIIKHIKRRETSNNPTDNVLIEISSFYLKKEIFKHLISKNHSETCTKHHQKIDFELIPDLVENKSVELFRGSAVIYCSQWKEVFQSLFKTFVLYEIKNQNILMENILLDPRINAIRQKITYLFTNNSNYGNITVLNIDDEVRNFPPCMEHLHLVLKRKHRLSHYARFYYTLFLKECGMKLEDAILYWRNEYIKPHNCDSLCTHDWHKDAKKFIYSIRHMYGLEGAKKDYKTPNCHNICEEIPAANYEGGCPFKNFDTDCLKSLLRNSMTETELNQFMVNAIKPRPVDTCANLFKFKSTTFIPDITITKPVQYYKQMINSA